MEVIQVGGNLVLSFSKLVYQKIFGKEKGYRNSFGVTEEQPQQYSRRGIQEISDLL